MLTPAELLDVLDEAITDTPWWAPRRVALRLRVRSLAALGESGRPIQMDGGEWVYGFTRAQCVRMRATMAAAARGDAGMLR